jgi:hypothetical protein
MKTLLIVTLLFSTSLFANDCATDIDCKNGEICQVQKVACEKNPESSTCAKRACIALPKPPETVTCSGKFAGLPNDAITVTLDTKTSIYKVEWVKANKETKELGTVKKFNELKFDLQCLDPKNADEIRKNVMEAEGIHGFLKIPKGKGALCYFVDETMTKCWSYYQKTKTFVDAGGWQT